MVRLLLSSIFPLHLPLSCMSSNFYIYIYFFFNLGFFKFILFFPHGPPTFQVSIIFLFLIILIIFLFTHTLWTFLTLPDILSLTRVPTSL